MVGEEAVSRRGGLLRDLGIPLAAWCLGAAVSAAAAAARGLSAADPATWTRWDSLLILDVASRGYHLVRDPHFMNGRLLEWSGNCAAFPLYPWLIRAASTLGAAPAAAGVALSALFQYLALAALWNGFLACEKREPALLLIACAAVFPGAIYEHAVSPVSLLTFLSTVFLYLILAKRDAAACFVGVLCGMTHGAGLFLSGVVFLWVLVRRRELRARIPALAAVAAAPAFGTFLFTAVLRIRTGRWDTALLSLELHRYGPWSWTRIAQMIYIPVVFRPTETTKIVVLAQAALVAALCGLLAWRRVARRAPLGRLESDRLAADLLLIQAWVFLIAPHLSPYRHSYYRVDAYLFPAVALCAGLPRKLLLAALAAFAVLSFLLADQFFLNILV